VSLNMMLPEIGVAWAADTPSMEAETRIAASSFLVCMMWLSGNDADIYATPMPDEKFVNIQGSYKARTVGM